MKLVEILARELKEWPAKIGELTQSCFDTEVLINDDDGTGLLPSIFLSTRHDEIGYPGVTRAQWEAERARIAAMEGISAFSQEQANAEAEREKRSQYEQELWDRVAQGWIAGASADSECSWSTSATQGHVEIACDVADAFMAERAKRLKSSS